MLDRPQPLPRPPFRGQFPVREGAPSQPGRSVRQMWWSREVTGPKYGHGRQGRRKRKVVNESLTHQMLWRGTAQKAASQAGVEIKAPEIFFAPFHHSVTRLWDGLGISESGQLRRLAHCGIGESGRPRPIVRAESASPAAHVLLQDAFFLVELGDLGHLADHLAPASRWGPTISATATTRTRTARAAGCIYNGTVEASRVPPDWHGWLHHTYAEPPTKAPLKVRGFETAAPAQPDRHRRRLSPRRQPGARAASARPPPATTRPGSRTES